MLWRFEISACFCACTLVALSAGTALADYTLNIDVLANADDFEGYNEVWGYTSPDGAELAIIGTLGGTAFYRADDPSAPELVGFIEGPPSVWRDMKTFGTFCYVVTEGRGAPLQIIDLSDPDQPRLVRTIDGFRSAHNIFIDEAGARAYVCGTDRGMLIFDLAPDPVEPREIGAYTAHYAHDVYVRNHVAYIASIFEGRLVIVDLEDPLRYREIVNLRYPGAATHNTWLSETGDVLVTTDEASGGHLRIWDVSELSEPRQLSAYVALGSVHNAFLRDKICFMSYYAAGIRAVSVADPEEPVEVGALDIFLEGPEDSGVVFDGVWGVYPFRSDASILYASGISTGLLILDFRNPVQAVRFDHQPVRDVADARRAPLAQVVCSGVLGTLDASSVSLVYQIDDDHDTRQSMRMLTNGDEPVANTGRFVAELAPMPAGSVVRYYLEARDTDGRAAVWPAGAPEERFTFAIGRVLERYAFDMEVDEGWTVEPGGAAGGVTSGAWERVDPTPNGRFDGGEWVVYVPDDDHGEDGRMAWVTGDEREGDQLGTHDVDGGSTRLLSPELELAGESMARLSYWLWYYTSANETTGEDAFTVELSNDGGASWIEADIVLASTERSWVERRLDIRSFVELTDRVQVRFTARDDGASTLIEALIDDVRIEVAPVTSTAMQQLAAPTAGESSIRFELPEPGPVKLRVYDVQGRLLRTLVDAVRGAGAHTVAWDGRTSRGAQVASGIYFLRLESRSTVVTGKILVER